MIVSIRWEITSVNVKLDMNCIRIKNDAKVNDIHIIIVIFINDFLLSSDACGGLIDSSNGTLTSPSFPDLYPANKNCIWEILAPPQWRITINFTHFDIEGNNVSEIVKNIIYDL